jgi:hypothetical protein
MSVGPTETNSVQKCSVSIHIWHQLHLKATSDIGSSFGAHVRKEEFGMLIGPNCVGTT